MKELKNPQLQCRGFKYARSLDYNGWPCELLVHYVFVDGPWGHELKKKEMPKVVCSRNNRCHRVANDKKLIM